ncbi:MAG: T9SS type A sorting domain-containing protein [candidate division Zixibacteria bacterium]|nr:T9SS type A sorting domain-containing protein [candidate division Zixibacteria bacterium]
MRLHRVLRLGLFLSLLLLLAPTKSIFGGDGGDASVPYYDPYDNNPPGPPPNYNLVDSSYFLGVPELPEPLETNVGGYYIYYDTAAGKWNIANHLYSRGNSLEQFHGSILAIMEQDPAPGVNVWAQGFELFDNLKQNDRWGWVRWPDSIAVNLYEIWWDYTIDYAKMKDTGDYRDTLGVTVAGCAIDFNIWSSGHGGPFDADQVYLGDSMMLLSDVPGFIDTYAGITDQYQVNDPVSDPNTSRFTSKVLPGVTYNVDGVIPAGGSEYNDRYSGSWAYEGNGLQFATQFCPDNQVPTFVDGGSQTIDPLLCLGETIHDTIVATDPDPFDTLTMTLLSGPGSFSSTPSTTPVTGYYEYTPTASGSFDMVIEVCDGSGGFDTLTVEYNVTVSSAPVVTISDSSVFSCGPLEICLPVDIIDNDCDVTSVSTDFGDYTGTLAGFDQVGRINQLGGSITQIGGGGPGTILYSAADFVPPVNSQSGVAVTLPNFIFAATVQDYGTFPNGIEPGNSADHLLNAPTDLTFTSPGPGGPDGGDGDGSVSFSSGDHCVVEFNEEITTCHGSNTDFVLFTNSNGGGSGTLTFSLDGTVTHTVTRTVPGGSASSGVGGITFDLPDGIVFNELEMECNSGTLEIDAFAARTMPSATTADICFFADTAGVYQITVTAEDACGNVGSSTAYLAVDLNEAPTAAAGNDFSRFMCVWEEICFDVSFSDPDDNIAYTELYSGPGSMVNDQICFTPAMAGAFTFVIHAEDDCGLHAYDTVVVSISDNDPPIATDPQDVAMFMCQASELCHDFSAMDPNGGPLSWTHLAGVGTITTGGHFCFTPTVSGTYSAVVIVTDSCGAADTTSIFYDLTINTAPVATDPGGPVAVFQCNPEEICYQFAATDPENGTLTWSLISGVGALSVGGSYCFTPSGAGSYVVTVAVTDSCGRADTTSLTYDITLNGGPTIVAGADTTLQLCAAQSICVSYTVTDAQGPGGLIETLVSGYGTIDTAANEVCFTPTTDGCYDIIVQATDPCGETDEDTVTVCVSFGDFAQIDCPTEPIDVFLCQADQVCQALSVTPSSATVFASHGIYSNGELCFNADTSGTYIISVVAAAECGSDTCQLTFNVDIGQAAQIDCPDPTSKFICEAGSICLPVGIFGTGATATVGPVGTYSSGSLCFAADSSGHYEILVVATTDCGTDSCLVIADVTINSPPVATDPSPVDTFMCAAAEICYQFAAGDPDGGTLTYARLSGAGTVTSDGLWCFTGTDGSHSVEVVVSDSCGAADTTTMTYNFTINAAPLVDLGNDTTRFVCASGIVCQLYSASDTDDNLVSLELIWGNGTLDTAENKLCFDPPVSGIYEFIVKGTDACGAEGYDTLLVTIDINEAPIVDAGPDLTIFDCSLQETCWSASASDPDGNLTSVVLIEGPGVFDGSTICFTPTGTYNYEFILKATDFCGAESVDTVAVYFTLNTPPRADAGDDQTLFQCAPSEVCQPVSCADIDGNLSGCALVAGPGTYNGSEICFLPSASGVYEFIIEASDACGSTDRDTVLIDVTINAAPVCTVPNDTLIFQCAAAQICLPAYATDADGNLAFCQITSGPGTLVGNDWCYMPVSDQTVTVSLRCEDSCGAVCETQFTVQIDINGPPEIAFGNDTSIFLCASTEICLPYVATDPDDPRLTTVTLVSGPGGLDEPNSQVCFTPVAGGSNTFIIRIEDECGEFDEDTITVDVTFNSAPISSAGSDQTLFLCGPDETICWPASCTDVDGNLTDCAFYGPGLYDGGSICFNPTVSGAFVFTLSALDECGESHADTVTINVTLNAAPAMAAANDTALFLCAPEEICFGYAVSDPDGSAGLIESMVSGYGSLDSATNQVCFTPTVDGCYEFILSVTDSCGAVGLDTVQVCVTFGDFAFIDCPAQPIDIFLCQPDTICQPLPITPQSATVWVSFGWYSGGQLCLPVDTAGVYSVTVIATESCGADTCTLTFNVDFNSPPSANAGADFSVFQCAPTEICWPATCSDSDANLSTCSLISGPGSYNGSQLCFTPPGSGTYPFVIRATDDCGATDVDTVNVNVTINTAPWLTAQADSSLFLCNPQEVCISYEAGDVDAGDVLTEELASGFGVIDTLTKTVCFTPTAAGSYQFVVRVTDGCGQTAEDTVVVTVSFGEFAQIDCPTGPIDVFLCQIDSVCHSLAVTPATASVSVSHGTYINGTLCFLADTSGTYVIDVVATETCGADSCRVTFNVDIGQAASIDCPPPSAHFICEAGSVCIPVGIYGSGATVTVSPIGTHSAGNLCFDADSSGHYEIEIIASTSCGTDTCLVAADVVINSSPIVVDPPSPVDTFMCATSQICYQFAAADFDGGALTWARLSGDGTVTTDGLWCFSANGGGVKSVTVVVSDSCGAADTTTLQYNITLNNAPLVTLGNDTTIFLCDGAAYCFDYSVADADDNVVLELLVSGSGAIDTVDDEVCFTPTESGLYQFVVGATDACQAEGRDTINITVDLGTAVAITCAADTAMFLCAPQEVCRPVTVSDASATVTVSPFGYYDAGEVCFDVDTAGHYVLSVSAESDCGSDNCQIVVDVTLNSGPYVEELAPVDTFICEPGSFCCPFAAHDDDGDDLTWSRLSGDGTVSPDGEWCFDAPVSGTYTACAVVTDGCGAADTLCHSYTVTINSPPDIAFSSNKNSGVFLCTGGTVCASYTATDPDDNITGEQLLSAYGTIDTVANEICFAADTSGDYLVIVSVTDGCGAVDSATLTITVQINSSPVTDAGSDRTVFRCGATEICWPASCSDPDDNLDSCYLTEGVGIHAAGQICFTPSSSGLYTFVLRSVDDCGAFDEDTVRIDVTINSPPVCDVAGDTSYFQCSPTQVSRRVTATDIDGNFDHCEIITGPGSIIDSFWVYTPTADQSVTVHVMCLDDCGAYCEDSFTVDININSSPLVDAGEDRSWFFCDPETRCFGVTASDVDGNLAAVELIDGPVGASYNSGTGDICFAVPPGERYYDFVLRATDSCGAMAFDTARITVQYNAPPTLDVINNPTVYLEEPGEVCYPVDVDDEDGNLSSVSTSLGSYDPTNDRICFTADTSGTYCMIVTATDECLESVSDTVCVTVVIDECIHVQIEKTHNAIQGQMETVSIFLNGSGKELGGYDILVAYDQSALSVQSAVPGLLHNNCGWEYFNYRHGADGNCGNACPSGLLRITAFAETNNGANHPGCFLDGMVGSIADINFLVSDDRTLECQFVPVSFFWMDCGDNGFSGRVGDTLWISRNVYSFENQNITDPNYGFPGYFGAPDSCLIGGDPDKPTPLRCVDFTNGGVDIVCADSIDDRADINLNGVSYEVADAVVFSNYFVYGLSVFNVNVDGQIAATDVNADGITLSVADLVYLIRVIVGDTPPMPKFAPGQTPKAHLAVRNGVLTVIESDYRIGAISVILDGETEPQLHENATAMEMRYSHDGERTRVLIYNMNGRAFLETGPVLKLGGDVEVVSVDVGSYDGFTLTGKIKALPEDFHLAQNYPNPFNPSTTFEFALPVAAEWRLMVYNVLGQTVRTWRGENDAGYVRVDWDASAHASGVYFYRLQADSFTSTKKMVLLK